MVKVKRKKRYKVYIFYFLCINGIFILDYMTHELTNLNKLYNGMNVHNSRFISTKSSSVTQKGP